MEAGYTRMADRSISIIRRCHIAGQNLFFNLITLESAADHSLQSLALIEYKWLLGNRNAKRACQDRVWWLLGPEIWNIICFYQVHDAILRTVGQRYISTAFYSYVKEFGHSLWRRTLNFISYSHKSSQCLSGQLPWEKIRKMQLECKSYIWKLKNDWMF